MDWTATGAIIGALTGILSLLGIIYMLGYKLSSIDTKLSLLWKVFIEDNLRGQVQQGNLVHSSPYKLTRSLTSDKFLSKDVISVLRKKPQLTNDQLAIEIISKVGFDSISSLSMKYDMTTQEYVALCVGAVRSLD
tara:strand:- start:46 stop:450 length:405 start_codon:yes stop_codon:yes gene_type:complete